MERNVKPNASLGGARTLYSLCCYSSAVGELILVINYGLGVTKGIEPSMDLMIP